MEIKISLALHIIGIVMWVGGLLVLTRFFKLFTAAIPKDESLAKLLGRIYYGYVVPGFLLALITGIVQLSYRGAQFYLAQGWFHAKLGLVLLLIVVTAVSFYDLKKVRSGKTLSRARVAALHGIVGLVLLVVVFLTVLNTALIQ